MHSGTNVVSGSIDDVEMLMEDANSVDWLCMAVDSDTFDGDTDVVIDAERCDVVSLVEIDDGKAALPLGLIDVKSSSELETGLWVVESEDG